jgi:iron-sulfur cluster assembly protein
MGTFHQNKSALHGITVVVDTVGSRIYIGRCEDEDAQQIALLDVDFHDDGQNGKSKADYVKRSAKFGTWKKLDSIVLPRQEVVSVTRLGEVPASKEVVPAPSVTPEITIAAMAPVAPAAPALVTLTATAQTEVLRLIAEQQLTQNRDGLGLRLGVKGGGCSGFSYKLEFDQKKDGDVVVTYTDFNVYLDKKSVVYLRGITLDFQKGLAGKGFVFNNPNATNTCGCGESFSI